MFQPLRLGTATVPHGVTGIRAKWLRGLYLYAPLHDAMEPLVSGQRAMMQAYGENRATAYLTPNTAAGSGKFFYASRDAYGAFYGASASGNNHGLQFSQSSGLNIVAPLAVSCWARVDEAGQRVYFLVKAAGASFNIFMFVENTGMPRFGFRAVGPTADGTQAIPLGVWNHYCGTYDGTFTRLYVNGRLVGSDNSGTLTPDTVAAELSIVGAVTGGGQTRAGAIREVAVWSGRQPPINGADAAELYRDITLLESRGRDVSSLFMPGGVLKPA